MRSSDDDGGSDESAQPVLKPVNKETNENNDTSFSSDRSILRKM